MTGVPTSASNGDTFDVTFSVAPDAGAGSSVHYILLYTSDGYNMPVPILLNIQWGPHRGELRRGNIAV